MALRPLVVKLHFYHPQGQGKATMAGATAHLKYMGAPKKEELVREHEVLREAGVEEALIHARYMGERPGSEGYFGPDSSKPPDVHEMQSAIASHNGPIWRLIVSVAEDDALAMGGDLMHRKAWEDAVRSSIPKMAHEMGLKNVRWTAAMHRKEGHPHIHLLLWENEPKRQRGKLSSHELTSSKRAWVSALYGPERERLGREKAALRQTIKERGAEAVKEATATREPRLTNADQGELVRRLVRIKEGLPGSGRLALAYMPAPLKQEILDVADWLLRSDASLWQATQRYGVIAGEMAQHYSDAPEAHAKARDKALTDIKERMASAILRGAVSLDKQAAWREVSGSVWSAMRGEGDTVDAAFSARVQRAVSDLASHPTKSQAQAEARRLLADPSVAASLDRMIQRATSHLPAEKQAERAEQLRTQVEARMAATLLRNATYVRDYRIQAVSTMVGGMFQGLMRDVQKLEREAERIAAEEEALLKRRAADQLSLQGY